MALRTSGNIITAGIITDSLIEAGMLLPGHTLLSLTVVRSSVHNGGCYIILSKGIYSKHFKVYRPLGCCCICKTLQTYEILQKELQARDKSMSNCFSGSNFIYNVMLDCPSKLYLPEYCQVVSFAPIQKASERTNLGSVVYLKKNPQYKQLLKIS